jgi:DNA primase small subunit
MFIPWGGKPPDRHRGFSDKRELLHYLHHKAPHSCFHSTAYYNDPSERNMVDKGWMGADLIFDLDGDHLPGVSDTDFPKMIELVQEQAWRLWSEFLEPEFGFREQYVQITFSGHRGFHIHVRDPAYLHLDSNARRQLVNYIRGEGVNVQDVFSGYESGWKSRVQLGVDDVLLKLRAISDGSDEKTSLLTEFHEVMKQRIRHPDCSVKSCSKAKLQKLAKLSQDEGRIQRLREDSSLRVFPGDSTSIFWELVKGTPLPVGETDEAVTVDVKRVIRWVGSLHGKCGLRVTELPLTRLDPDSSNAFDPLSEAVAFTGNNSMKVELTSDDVIARVSDFEVDGGTGDVFEVPESMATFLSLKGWGNVQST